MKITIGFSKGEIDFIELEGDYVHGDQIKTILETIAELKKHE